MVGYLGKLNVMKKKNVFNKGSCSSERVFKRVKVLLLQNKENYTWQKISRNLFIHKFRN